MDETTAPALKGYRGDGPVRIGNAAAEQVQNDTYGSIILAAMPMFFDRRLPRLGDEGLFRLLETLGGKAGELALEADNGIWEYRGRQRIHTHSTAMCWAGCHRLAAIASHSACRTGPPIGTPLPTPSAKRSCRGLERQTASLYRRVRFGRS